MQVWCVCVCVCSRLFGEVHLSLFKTQLIPYLILELCPHPASAPACVCYILERHCPLIINAGGEVDRDKTQRAVEEWMLLWKWCLLFSLWAKSPPHAVLREQENFRQAPTSCMYTNTHMHIYLRTLGGLTGACRWRQRCLRAGFLPPTYHHLTSAPQRHSCSPARGQAQVSIRRRVVKITSAFFCSYLLLFLPPLTP